MQLAFPRSKMRCRPLQVVDDMEAGAGLLGGRAPEGVAPRTTGPNTRYFATVPLCAAPPLAVSVFLNFSFSEMFDASGELSPERLIEPVVHVPVDRSRANAAIDSELAARRLRVLPEQSDVFMSEDGPIVAPYHKLGGRAYVFRTASSLASRVAEAEAQGFRHIFQLDVMGPDDDPPSGNWPFADGVFHLLGRPPFASASTTAWQWYWERC